MHTVIILNSALTPVYCNVFEDEHEAYLEFGSQAIMRGAKADHISKQVSSITTPDGDVVVMCSAGSATWGDEVLGKLAQHEGLQQ